MSRPSRAPLHQPAALRVLAGLLVGSAPLCTHAQSGYSVMTPALGFTVPSAPPQPPADVSVAASSDTALAVSWTPPLDDGGTDLLAYKVSHSS